MLTRLFIKKATLERITFILDKEGFIYAPSDIEELLKGNQKGLRYGNIVLSRKEGGVQRDFFIKIVLDGTRRTSRLFRRQVNITAALHDDTTFNAPTMAIIKSSLGGPVPYAIFETREDGDGFGFMHDTPESYAAFTERDVRQLVEVVYAFHRAGLHIGKRALRYARPISSQLKQYKREYENLLNKSIMHRYQDGFEIEKTVEEFLASYTGVPDIRGRIARLFERNWEYVRLSETRNGPYLVHADMQIDNVYKHKNGQFELLDFEWVGKVDNPVVAIMYDYGNLRARAWSSPRFQSMLDKEMHDVGIELYGNPVMVEAAMTLGVARSSLIMSRYHLDVINTLKNDKRTEAQYYDMYRATISALKEVLREF